MTNFLLGLAAIGCLLPIVGIWRIVYEKSRFNGKSYDAPDMLSWVAGAFFISLWAVGGLIAIAKLSMN